MRPIDSINNRCSRTHKSNIVRPVHGSGMRLLRNWFEEQDWSENLNATLVDRKAELLLSQVNMAVNKYLPEKSIRVASDDEPWFNRSLKKLDRKRRREYNKNRRSDKYLSLSRLYKDKISKEKKTV